MTDEYPEICKNCISVTRDLGCPKYHKPIDRFCLWRVEEPGYDIRKIGVKRKDRICPICGKGWMGAYGDDNFDSYPPYKMFIVMRCSNYKECGFIAIQQIYPRYNDLYSILGENPQDLDGREHLTPEECEKVCNHLLNLSDEECMKINEKVKEADKWLKQICNAPSPVKYPYRREKE